MNDLQPYLEERRTTVNKALENALLQLAIADDRLAAAMRHSLMAGGKRLRPILCMAAAEAVGDGFQRILPAACALEFIHTYSLIHDDLPALDNDLLRRGKPTCHAAFDEATALLAGDALLTGAFEILLNTDTAATPHHPRLLDALLVLTRASGAAGMVAGQIKDMIAEQQQLNLDELARIHQLKTGALIEASVEIGAILANGSEEETQRLSRFAGHIGLAFQVVDDVLNVKGDPVTLGKAVGTDADRAKNTYPSLMGLKASEAKAQSLISKALATVEPFDDRADPLRALARYVVDRTR